VRSIEHLSECRPGLATIGADRPVQAAPLRLVARSTAGDAVSSAQKRNESPIVELGDAGSL